MERIVVISKQELSKTIMDLLDEVFQKYERKKPPVLINRKDAAARVGVSPATISSWIKLGKLKNFSASKKVLISEEELNTLHVRSYTRYKK